MSAAICAISGSPMPAVVTAGVPSRSPLVTNGERGSSGIGVLVEGDAGPVEHLLGHLAGELGVEGAQVDQHQVVVGAARDEPEALAGQGLGQGLGVGARSGRRTSRNSGWAASAKATALAAMTCSSGPPCRPGNTALSMAVASSARQRMAAAARAAQRLVGGEGDDVGHADRVGVGAAGDEAGDVGGVEDEAGRRPRRRSRGTGSGSMIRGVGGGAGHDQLGPVLAWPGRGQLVEVDAARRSSVTP